MMAKPCIFVNRYKPESSSDNALAWIWNEFARPSEYYDDECNLKTASSKFDEVLHFKNGEGVEYLRICYTVIEDGNEKYVVEELDVGLLTEDLTEDLVRYEIASVCDADDDPEEDIYCS